MDNTITVTTQAEMDAAIARQQADPSVRIEVHDSARVNAYGSARVNASGSARVNAYGSAMVYAYGSASVTASDSTRVNAYGSAMVYAYGSASVTARGSAMVYAFDSASVTASDSVSVYAFDSASVYASRFVTILRQSPLSTVTGGQVPDLSTPLGWCEYTGATEASPGTRILYKGLDAEFCSGHGTVYLPGTEIVAPDWDGGAEECGGGLHFCAHPEATLQFVEAVRFVACEVAEADMAAHEYPQYSNKIKARACRVLYECDVHGERITS